jgi:hypothetical protein
MVSNSIDPISVYEIKRERRFETCYIPQRPSRLRPVRPIRWIVRIGED